ncbi:MAG TPA: ATP-grasp domain-containing protein [bacterium]|nr:ATP-grasp domain-containing protein [bacterium]
MTERIAVLLHNPVDPNARKDDLDLFEEMQAVEAALTTLGWKHTRIVFDTDIARVKRELDAVKAGVVFNLVETLEGKGSHQYLAPALLEHWGIKYTGGTAESLFITTDKLLAKELLTLNRIPTPECFCPGRFEQLVPDARYIVKAVDEDASLGMDAKSILTPSEGDDLAAFIRGKEKTHGVRFFAERFIEGREFNLTVLGMNGAPQILSPAEIRFINFGDKRPKIVDYRAKWEEKSFEYKNTQRSFDFPPEDAPLLARLGELAGQCWRELRLAGYARVDFRVDEQGNPWVLEVNVNPCITHYGGVAAACERAGISYDTFVARIVAEALR